METRRRMAVVLLMSAAGLAAADVITFEAPTYAPGNVDGQDGWSIVAGASGTAAVIEYPAGSGNHVLRLQTQTAGVGYRVRIRRSTGIPEITAPAFVTLEYDLWYFSATGNVGPILRARMGDDNEPGNFAWYAFHQDGGGRPGSRSGCQYYLARLPDGSALNYQIDGSPDIGQIVDGGTVHHVAWHYFCSGVDNGGSHLMYKVVDGVRYDARNAYLGNLSAATCTTPDIVEFALLHNAGTAGATTWHVDNLSIAVTTGADPAPVAEASGPYTAPPCPTLVDATGSTTPATYQWCHTTTAGVAQVLDLTTASLTDHATFPDGTTPVVLNVVDARGVYSSDTTTVTVTGACCLGDATCQELSEADCAVAFGESLGDCTTCAEVEPCAPPEACCQGTTCVLLAPVSCGLQGGEPQGQMTCAPDPCLPAVCCFLDGHCAMIPVPDCAAEGGMTRTDLTACQPNQCPQPGACCLGLGGCCIFTTEADCQGKIGTFQGVGAPCITNVTCGLYCNPFDSTAGAGTGEPGDVYLDTRDGDQGVFVDVPDGDGGHGMGVTLPCPESWAGDLRLTIALRVDDPDHTLGPDGTNAFGSLRIYGSNGACRSFGIDTPTNQGWAIFSDCVGHGTNEGDFDPDTVTSLTIEKTVSVPCHYTLAVGDFCLAHDAACIGACCLADGTCVEAVTEAECATAGAAQFQCPGTISLGQTCVQVEPCPLIPGACCHLDGTCTAALPEDCALAGGESLGYGVPCEPNPCDQPGACCMADGSCTVTPAWACAAAGGILKGDGSVCDPVPTACYGDADCSTEINFADISYFVAALAGGETGWTNYYQSKHAGTPPPCTLWNCDANGSGRCADPQAPEVDFDDIRPFVAKLVTPPPCP